MTGSPAWSAIAQLLVQRVLPSEIWVNDPNSHDGGKAIRRLIESIDHTGRVKVMSVTSHQGAANGSGTATLASSMYLQLALQVSVSITCYLPMFNA